MKKFNLKHFTSLLLATFLLQGCMPDSLTKFSKDAPKKNSSPAVATVPSGSSSGGSVSVSEIIPPTTFTYDSNDIVMVVGRTDNFTISGDNDFSGKTTRERIITNCTTTPSLPAGLGVSINPKTCAISGTPVQVFTNTAYDSTNKGKVDYVVTVSFINNSGTTSTLTRSIKFQALQAPANLKYTQSPKVILKVAGDLSSFSSSSGNLVTNDGKVTSDLTKNTIYGNVETIDLSNNLLGVKNIRHYDNANPSGQAYTDANNDSQPDGAGEAVKANYYFSVGDSIDSDVNFYQKRGVISEIRNILPTVAVQPAVSDFSTLQPIDDPTDGVNVNDTTSKRNYIEFTISPKLPTDVSGLNQYSFSFDPMTGKISGWSKVPIPMTEYTITASNLAGSSTYLVKFEVAEAPTQYALTNNQLLTVSALAFSYLKEGDTIVAPIVTPRTESVKGFITKTISATNQIEVRTSNGAFAKGDFIDQGQTYNASIGSILNTPMNFNAALVMSGAETIPNGGTIVGDMYLLNNTGAALVGNRVYVSTTNLSSITVGSTLLTQTISEIDSRSLAVTLNSAPSYDLTGSDVLSSNAAFTGYVRLNDLTGGVTPTTKIYISDAYRSINPSDVSSRNLRPTDTLKFDEKISGSGITKTASVVAYDNFYSAERTVYMELQPSLKTGSGITYNVTPALPTGLTLNTKTGLISGTPVEASALATYTLTAKNLFGTSTIYLKLEVRDYFALAEVSNAPSYKFHKVGDYKNATACKINGSDIYNARGNLDIRCELDGEEEDLHFFGANLQAKVGPGVCQFVSITPYHFWKWAPKQTSGTVVRWVNANTITASDREITSELDCDGNYTLEGGPNCDEGSITVNTYAYDPQAPAVEAFQSTTVLKCGGKKTNCMDGPITDLLTSTQLASGMRGLITNSDSGYTNTWKFSSPGTKGDLTNLRVANNHYVDNTTLGSLCDDTKTKVDNWTNLNYSGSGIPLHTILDTATVATYAVGADTDYYSSSKYLINGSPRGLFKTANNARSVKPYKTVNIKSTYSPFEGTYPYYQISCLDAAQETKATITVIIRDWNKTFKLQNEIDKAQPIGMRQGICSSLSYTTSASCTGAGATWRNYVDFGTCSDGVSTTQAACTGGGGIWTLAQGMCSDASSTTKVLCTAASGIWYDNLMRAVGGSALNPTNYFYDWIDNYSGSGVKPLYNACTGSSTDRPTYTQPATSGAVPAMVYPASTEYQFPEDGI